MITRTIDARGRDAYTAAVDSQVFEFTDPVEFLSASFGRMQKSNPQFSLRAWSKQLGLSNVAMLSMVLNRKRRLLPSLASRISRQFIQSRRFTEVEARYFDVLVQFSAARTTEEKLFYERILTTLRPSRQFSVVELDQFRVIADWYHLAIVEMTQLKDFRSDPRWIRSRLGAKINDGQVRQAVDRLIRVGLLQKGPGGKLQKTIARYATPTDLPNTAIREFHSQMIRKALTALKTQSVEQRDITAHTLTIARKKLPEAKRMIREFRRSLAEFLETPGGDAVYQLNVQLFDALAGETDEDLDS